MCTGPTRGHQRARAITQVPQKLRLVSTIHAIRIMNWTARWAIYAILHVTAVLNSAPFWLWADLLSSRFWNFNMIELKIVTSLLLSPSDSGLSSKCRAISACSTLVEVVEVNSSFKDVNRLWSHLKNNGAKRCLSKLLNLHILGKWKTTSHCPRTFRLVTLLMSW